MTWSFSFELFYTSHFVVLYSLLCGVSQGSTRKVIMLLGAYINDIWSLVDSCFVDNYTTSSYLFFVYCFVYKSVRYFSRLNCFTLVVLIPFGRYGILSAGLAIR